MLLLLRRFPLPSFFLLFFALFAKPVILLPRLVAPARAEIKIRSDHKTIKAGETFDLQKIGSIDQLLLCCYYSLVNANTVPVVPLITPITSDHPVLLVVRLRWIVLVLANRTYLSDDADK